MSGVDERVVGLEFNGKDFGRGVQTALKDLENLQKGLKLDGATAGLDQVERAASRFSLAGIHSQTSGLLGQFSALQVTAVTALATIANKAVVAGGQLVKSFTLDPIKSGLTEYETNLNSIQTILANTGKEGAQGLGEVNKALEELNTYSDQTIYNFSEMARNIGTFTAAGVDLDTATGAIKGIANLAAVSGSNSQQASTAMYQLSQALAAGKVGLQDWNSVVNAGMGGKVFQDALLQTAKVQGKSVDSIIKGNKSFRDSLQDGWLTGDVLKTTLMQFSGDLNEAQLKSMGYNEKQIAGIIKMGKTAVAAATEVKTVSQLMGTLQEATGSGWAKTWQLAIGDFDEAKTVFTGINNVLGGMISASADARNKVLGDWKELGGRTAIIDAVKASFGALMGVLSPIRKAFVQIFPPATGKQLYEISVAIRDFAQGLKVSGTTAKNIQRTFAGAFAILGIGYEVVKQLVVSLASLFGVAGEGAGGFLETTAGIGDFLVALHKAIAEGEGLKRFFDGLVTVLSVPIKLLQSIGRVITALFSGFDPGPASDAVANLINGLDPLAALGQLIVAVFGGVGKVLDNVADFFEPLAVKMGAFFGDFGASISEYVKNLDYDKLLAGIQTGLFAALLLLIKNFGVNFAANFNLFGGEGDGLISNISSSFEELTGTLSAMQGALKASTLLQIAAAVGILTLSVIGLSQIDSEGLTRALTAISVMFGQLIGVTAAFSAIGGVRAFAKLPFVAGALILLSGAVLILSKALENLSGLSWEELAKGLTGITGILAAFVGAAYGLQGAAGGMIRSGAGLILLATGIKILASAVEDLSGISWEEMGRGLTGIAGLLTALALFGKISAANKVGVIQAAGIILLAAGLKIMASAVKDFSDMSWDDMSRGLTGMAGGLFAISVALQALPPSSLLSAAAIFIVAASLGKIGDALGTMGDMSWEQIGKSMTVLAGSLGIIAGALALMTAALPGAAALIVVAGALSIMTPALVAMGNMDWENIGKAMTVLTGTLTLLAAAMYVMTAALPGAAALIVAAAALQILAPALQVMGDMSWEQIGRGLTLMAGAFTVLGVAGLLLTPVIPSLLALGAAILLLGAGVGLAGAGLLALSVGLTGLAASGAVGTAALVAMVSALIGLIPAIAEALGEGFVAFVGVIGDSGEAVTDAFVQILNALLDAVIEIMPKADLLFFKLLNNLMIIMRESIPEFADTGLLMITGLLLAIRDRIPLMVTIAGQIVVAFLNALGRQLPAIADAGVRLLVTFVNSIANAVRKNQQPMNAAGRNLASAIVEGMVNGITGGIGSVATAAKNLAQGALTAAKNKLGIASPSKEFKKLGEYVNEGFAIGLQGDRAKIEDAVKTMTEKLFDAMERYKEQIDSTKEKIQQLTEARDEDNRKIAESSATIREAQQKDADAIANAQAALTRAQKAKKKDANAIRAAQYDLDVARQRKNEAKAREDLAKLTASRDKNVKSIADETAALRQANIERARADLTYGLMTRTIEKQKAALTTLADRYDFLSERIKDATSDLDAAFQQRADYAKSISSQFSALPSIDESTGLSGFLEDMQSRIDKTRSFTSALDMLRKQGLNDTLYKEFLDKGPESLPFISQLNAGGKGAIDQINSLSKELGSLSSALGDSASRELYDTGIRSAQGLVQGLLSQRNDVKNEMDRIGAEMLTSIKKRLGIASPSKEMAIVGEYSTDGLKQGLDKGAEGLRSKSAQVGGYMVQGMVQGLNNGIPSVNAAAEGVASAALAAAKRRLGIRSPSREFMYIGQFSSKGMANGFLNYSSVVSDAAASVGQQALLSMSKSIAGLSELVQGDMDIHPTITPILDLTAIKKDASTINGLLQAPLSLSDAYISAQNASASYENTRELTQEQSVPGSTTFEFHQTNTSPKALSAADIYRQTKNQISIAKEVLSNA